DGLLEFPEFKIHVGLIIRQFFVQHLLIRNLVKLLVCLHIIVLLVGYISQIIFGLRTIGRGGGYFVKVGFRFLGFFGRKEGISIIKVEAFLLFPAHGTLIYLIIP